ncbi:MAG TPA: hypothetical protein VJP77_04195 [Planctomycetota bacterium]|nr:hypothetical protein [Planctomycetota bacterium]
MTLLGILLSSGGPTAEDLLCRNLEYLVRRFHADAHVKDVTRNEVQSALNLSDTETNLIFRLVQIANLYSSSIGLPTDDWRFGVPHDIDEIADNQELLECIYARALPELPPQPELLPFVEDPRLREVLAADLAEIERCYEARGWKAVVILCGSLLEGMLQAALESDGAELDERASLEELVQEARARNILRAPYEAAGHATRLFRNTIHPSAQVRDTSVYNEREARLVYSMAAVCREEIERWYIDLVRQARPN